MATLIGQSSIPAGPQDSTIIGAPAAVQFTALSTGTVDTLRWYINGYGGSGPSTIYLGIYADAGDSIGALLGQGSVAAPGVGALPAWATVSALSIAVTAGTKYWIAVCPVGGSGNMGWQDTIASGGGYMALESIGSKTNLPASTTWGYGTRGPFAAYGTGTAQAGSLINLGSLTANGRSSGALSFSVSGPVTVDQIVYCYAGSGSGTHPEQSIGGPIGGVAVGGADNNAFFDVTSSEATTGEDYYVCLYVRNTNNATTWQSPRIWVDQQPAGGEGTLEIGRDSAAAGSTAVSSSVDRFTAPNPVVSFSSPSTKPAGLVLNDIPPNSYQAFWLHLNIPAGVAAADLLGCSFRIEGDTPG